MSKSGNKKEIIFRRYSANLKHLSKILGVAINPERKDDLYICPLTFKVYDIKGLSDEYDDQLTIEHVPPASVNGKGICLTAKEANSRAGSTIDDSIRKSIALSDHNTLGKPLQLNGNIEGVKMKIILGRDKDDNPEIWFKPNTYHQGTKRVEDIIKNKENFKFNLPVTFKKRNLEIALLKTAYLIAFSHMGYSLLFGLTTMVNQNYQKIRGQILNPEESILDEVLIFNDSFEDEDLGVNILYEPFDIRSLLIVFDIETDDSKHRYGVLMPAIDDYGFSGVKSMIKRMIGDEEFTYRYKNVKRIQLDEENHAGRLYEEWIAVNGTTRNQS